MKTSKKIIFSAIILIALAGAGSIAYLYLGRADASQQPVNYVAVKRTDLTQTVTASGQVKAASDISLSFQRPGVVAADNIDVGQAVRQGQVLASLDTSDLDIQLRSAQSALAAANLKLDQLENATDAAAPSTEIQTSINNSWESSANKIKEAYITADGVMGTSIDQFYDEPKSDNPIFGLTITEQNSTAQGPVNTTYTISAPIDTSFQLNKERRDITIAMEKWQDDINGLDQSNIDVAQSDAENSLAQIQNLLTGLADFINSYNPANAGDNQVYGSYKATVQNARASIDSTLAGILGAKQAYNSSKASANPDDIKLQEIAVINAQNQIDAIQNEIARSSILSPIDGLVSVSNVKTGQTAAAGVPLVGVFTNSNLQIDVYLPESDVAKVKAGQAATVTLDAFPGQTFKAHVIGIDPESAQNAEQGYKTTLQFDQNDSAIKPGMTANVSIQTGQKNGVLAIPAGSVIQKDGDSFVMVKAADKNGAMQKVTTGITGADGNVEVTSGLDEGEMIINY